MGRMSDLDIVRQEHGLPTCTPLEVLRALAVQDEQEAQEAAYWFRVSEAGEREFMREAMSADRLEELDGHA